jgi:hypothetical protein
LPWPTHHGKLDIMDQPANGQPPGSLPGVDVIIGRLVKLAVSAISAPTRPTISPLGDTGSEWSAARRLPRPTSPASFT